MNRKSFYLLLDSSSVSICNYKPVHSESVQTIINLHILEELINYANKYGYILSFVHGKELPVDYYRILSSCNNQTNIMGAELFEKLDYLPNITVSLDSGTINQLNRKKMSKDLGRSALLHFSKSSITDLFNSVVSLLRVTQRITLVCDDNSYFDDCYREQYENELEKVSSLLRYEFKLGKITEISVLTDSIFVDASNQCPAGINSFTFSTDGKLFPCPAFIGLSNWELSFSCDMPFQSGLESAFAFRPLCKSCPNTHCQRCAYINYLFTKEICIPPYDMCRVASAEKRIANSMLCQ